jgi:hypothetical protein
MSVVEILAIAMTACGMVAGVTAIVLHLRRPRFSASPGDVVALEGEVSKLRAEVGALRSGTAKLVADEVRRRPSTFMEMADAMNRLRHPIAYDEAMIHLRVLDMAFGKRVSIKLLNGKDVVFAVPPKTGNGTIFPVQGWRQDSRDLHLEVQAVVDTKDGGN